jgi:hypothetical protein
VERRAERALTLTPSLDVDPAAQEDDVIRAYRLIADSGGRAIAVVRSEATATEVLRMLGLTDAEIEDRWHFALTGRVLGGT